jgi:hypothetical protein
MSLLSKVSHDKPTKRVIMVYGAPSVGKTSLVSSLQDVEGFGPIVYVDTDHGRGRVVPEGVTATDEISSLAELSKVVTELKSGVEGHHTLVVDSLHTIVDMVFAHVTSASDSFTGDVRISQDTWTKRNRTAMMVINHLIKLPFANVIFTCGESVQRNDAGSITRITPMISDSLAVKIAHHMDNVFWLYQDTKGGRVLRIAPTAAIIAGNRSPGLEKKHGETIRLAGAGERQEKFIEMMRDI